ncbi:MAG: hypothetical protein COA79_23545 [Planctomycetota bacterium]|nr:MAG: hypothetical protein COA79_23545 [Planctomycetota bacterium]
MTKNELPKTIEISIPSRNKEHFLELAKLASKLKKYGNVSLNVADLAEMSSYEMPEGGSGWHEYTSYKPSVFHFFPDETIARHLPKEHVKKNKELILEKSKILKEHDLSAYVHFQEPYFLPESFFEEFPHLRGPRVDHPPRSTETAFAMCMDQKESLNIVTSMISELCKAVPMMARYSTQVNDAGSGLCWSDYNYPGMNGPSHCQTKNTGERMKGFISAIHEGAKKAGGDILVRLTGNLSRFEIDTLTPILPPLTQVTGKGRNVRHNITTGTMLGTGGTYPIKGLLNPVAIINAVSSWFNGNVAHLSLNFADGYGRGSDPLEALDKIIEIVDLVSENPPKGRIEKLECLKSLGKKWGGSSHAETLMDTWSNLQDALTMKAVSQGSFSTMYEGVSGRHITRPIVLQPEKLSLDEDGYALKHHFDMPKNLGRDDYTYIHGGNSTFNWSGDWYWIGPFQSALSMIKGVAATVEKLEDAPEFEWFKTQSRALRIYTSILNSINHCYFAQVFINKNKEALAKEPLQDANLGSGPAIKNEHQWYEILRTEMDNTAELINLLESGGMDQVEHAEKPEDEDCFLLGPNLIEDLKKKLTVMKAHWRDLESYVSICHN